MPPTSTLFLQIPVTQIRPSPYQPRKTFGSAGIEALAGSMRQEGLIQPITVRDTGSPARSRYELVSGERRLRAAQLLGWSTIEAKVIRTVSEGEAAAKSLVENLQREDLNPMEEAEGFYELNRLDPAYWTHEKIAEAAGKGRGYVTQAFGLLRLTGEVKDLVRHRTLGRSQALELLRLPKAKHQLELAKQAGRLTVHQLRQCVDTLLKKEPKKGSDQDPLINLWTSLLADPSVAPPGAWGVNYRKGQWRFWLKSQGADSREELSHWFECIAAALKSGDEPAEGSAPIPMAPAEASNEMPTDVFAERLRKALESLGPQKAGGEL